MAVMMTAAVATRRTERNTGNQDSMDVNQQRSLEEEIVLIFKSTGAIRT